MSLFVYDRLLQEDEICALEKEKKLIQDHIKNKHCVRVFGRRNFGKTSLIKNVIAQKWEAQRPDSRLLIYADLYPAKTTTTFHDILTHSLNSALSGKGGFFDKLKSALSKLKSLRPTFQPTSDGTSFEVKLSLSDNKPLDLTSWMESVETLSADYELLIVFDEFQEIAKIEGLAENLRGHFQELSSFPIVLLGSKYHILNKMFANPQSPFHKWGFSVEFKPIPYQTYHSYIMQRYQQKDLRMDETTSIYLQDIMHRIPEDINRLCDYVATTYSDRSIDQAFIDHCLDGYLESYESIYSQMFYQLTKNESEIILAFTKFNGSVEEPTSKAFLKQVSLSKQGTKKIIDKLEDDGIIYRLDKKYIIAEPLFYQYLKRQFGH